MPKGELLPTSARLTSTGGGGTFPHREAGGEKRTQALHMSEAVIAAFILLQHDIW